MKNKITMNNSSIIVLLITMILCTIYLCFMIKYKKKSYSTCYENFNLQIDNSCRSRFTICSTGYYCPPGSVIQTLCSEGFYCQNALSQIRCSTGSYCPLGSTNERNYLFQFVQKGNFVKQWANICLSGNGQYQTAIENYSAFIYSSADYGETWTNIISNDIPRTIVMSNSGQYRIFSSTFYLYVSSNYGSTWNQKISYSNSASVDLAISSDGKYQIVIGHNGSKYESNNFGSTWTGPNTIWTGIPSTNFPHKIAISSDGNYQLVAIARSGQPVYLSVDKGNNWRVVSLSLSYSDIWYGVSVSSSGKYQIGFQYNEYIIFSSDFGNNWIRIIISIGYSLRSSSISSTGQYIILGTSGYLYGSKDYGNTWNIIDNNLSWRRVSISADGIYSGAILSASSKIYISNSIS